ncbi:MAG TPA: amino acid adenylation domain-containing protein [Kofleriaceae bacterium]|nr:amino acid adenylation domain-containing protein [Kofleriaceae bacterium]
MAVAPRAAFESIVDRARIAPGHIAAIDGARRVTYGELVGHSTRIALQLRAAGVRQGGRVLLAANKSTAGVAAVLGIQRAGCAYAPIDPGWPADRVRRIWQELAPDAVVTEAAHGPLVQASAPPSGQRSWPGLVLDGPRLLAPGLDLSAPVPPAGHGPDLETAPDVAIRPDDAAYILFTSGSSGVPKGVEVLHENLAAFARWMIPTLGLGPTDRVVNPAPLTFDYSVQDVFVVLGSGAALALLSPSARLPGDILDLIEKERVSAITAVPSFYCFLSRLRPARFAAALGRLRLAQFSGEPFPVHELTHWMAELPEVEFVNAYGPTETTVIVSQRRVSRPPGPGPLPIGAGAPDRAIAVMRADGSEAAVDEIGELWIGGAQVAAGYLGSAELTARAFVARPGRPGERWYRTGDRGRRRADGELECLGRLDSQIKLSGRRVDLTEVELALASLPYVREAMVLPVADAAGTVTGLRAVVDATAPEGRVREDLRALLPEYMVPRVIERVDRIPRNASGKRDRKAI